MCVTWIEDWHRLDMPRRAYKLVVPVAPGRFISALEPHARSPQDELWRTGGVVRYVSGHTATAEPGLPGLYMVKDLVDAVYLLRHYQTNEVVIDVLIPSQTEVRSGTVRTAMAKTIATINAREIVVGREVDWDTLRLIAYKEFGHIPQRMKI